MSKQESITIDDPGLIEELTKLQKQKKFGHVSDVIMEMYEKYMTPSASPVSIGKMKLGPDVLSGLQEYATAKGITTDAALAKLISTGLSRLEALTKYNAKQPKKEGKPRAAKTPKEPKQAKEKKAKKASKKKAEESGGDVVTSTKNAALEKLSKVKDLRTKG